jgi:site-specific DNA-cytosine methylase
LDKGAEDGTRRNQDAPIIAAPLSHGSNPNSNMAGRRREDDENLVTAFHQTQDPITEENATPALGRTSIGMGVGQGASVRRLTPTECERLQALPDGWTDPTGDAPDSRRYAALGDAVTSSVAQWIGEQLVAHLQRQAA